MPILVFLETSSGLNVNCSMPPSPLHLVILLLQHRNIEERYLHSVLTILCNHISLFSGTTGSFMNEYIYIYIYIPFFLPTSHSHTFSLPSLSLY